MRDFYKDIRAFFKDAPNNERIISLYERGLITMNEAIKELVEDNNVHKVYYTIEYKPTTKGRYKPVDDILYEYEDATALMAKYENTAGYFRLKRTYKGMTQTLHA